MMDAHCLCLLLYNLAYCCNSKHQWNHIIPIHHYNSSIYPPLLLQSLYHSHHYSSQTRSLCLCMNLSLHLVYFLFSFSFVILKFSQIHFPSILVLSAIQKYRIRVYQCYSQILVRDQFVNYKLIIHSLCAFLLCSVVISCMILSTQSYHML